MPLRWGCRLSTNAGMTGADLRPTRGVLHAYGQYLPLTPETPLLSLGEGDTPLVRSQNIEREVGCAALYFKLEGCNPTGSFKDRGMVVAFAKAVEKGSTAVICASTGNTSASAAAYAARYGLRSIVVVPKGEVAVGKLAQATAYGSTLISLDGNFDEALDIVREITSRQPIALVNSLNPYRIEGQKTAAFEIIDVLGEAPDALFIPVGNAGNITAYWKGFKEYHEAGKSSTRPKMMGFQAAGAAPIVLGSPVHEPTTVASAIRIGNPASWQGALDAREESQGVIDMVTDEEILDAYQTLSRTEGLFVEPASAASVAGLRRVAQKKGALAGKTVVCVMTGSGLKDPDTANKHVVPDELKLPAEVSAVEGALGYR